MGPKDFSELLIVLKVYVQRGKNKFYELDLVYLEKPLTNMQMIKSGQNRSNRKYSAKF